MCPKFTYKSSNFRPCKRPEITAILRSASSGKEKDSETGYYYFGARYYNSDLSLWLSVDPMSDKYPSLSPYNYCLWNPLRVVDPDGRDGWDKIMGYGIGIITNIIPGSSGLRDSYAPTNTFDYNSSLQTADHVSVIVGGLMITAGAAGASAGTSMVAGGATVAATGIGAPEGAAIALSGATVDGISIATGLVGTSMVLQAVSNTSQGYDRGSESQNKTSHNSKTSGKNERHGDSGRSLSKAEKQIEQLKHQLQTADRRTRQKIEQKIKNITQNAARKNKGEEHSRTSKR